MKRAAQGPTPLEQSVMASLGSLKFSGEPAWLTERRAAALQQLRLQSLPTASDEEFRFLPLASIAGERLQLSGVVSAKSMPLAASPAIAASLGLVDGVPLGEVPALPPGLQIQRLQEILRLEPDLLEPYLGAVAAPSNVFAAVGLSAFRDAWVIRVAANSKIELPVEIVLQQASGGCWAIPRVLVILDAGSYLKIIERREAGTHEVTSLSTGVFEFALGASAILEHVRLCSNGSNEAELALTEVRVSAGAQYKSWTATSQGLLTRFDTHVRLEGAGAEAILDGLYLARGSEIIDHHTKVIHECANTRVSELYKGIVDDQAQAIFDGQIVVKSGANGTDAQQYNRNLLMSDRAVVHTKPQLEIDADDVACSHGATVGKLDEQQLFYLQSRGISGREAKGMLTTAFAAELVDRCPIAQAVTHVEKSFHLGAFTESSQP